jgi:hypothetical protein
VLAAVLGIGAGFGKVGISPFQPLIRIAVRQAFDGIVASSEIRTRILDAYPRGRCQHSHLCITR